MQARRSRRLCSHFLFLACRLRQIPGVAGGFRRARFMAARLVQVARSLSELVLLVSSPASEPAFKGAGVADTVWASSVSRGSSNCQWSGTFVVVWGRVLGLRT
ncbi:hypothetical protein MRX96_023342 [Rhipicephalus microplus]